MIFHAGNPQARAIWLLAVVTCLLAPSTGFSQMPPNQTPASEGGHIVVPPTARAEATAGEPSGSSKPAGAVSRRAICEDYIAVLSGRKKDARLLEDPEVQALAGLVPDLVTCGAVLQGSDELCQVLKGLGTVQYCRDMRSSFHQARISPEGRSFMFSDVFLQDCYGDFSKEFCDSFRAAMRSGDERKCASLGKGKTLCRAYITLDKSLCGGDADCEKDIEKKGVLAKGLKEVAKSGPSPQRQFAKAALGQTDACVFPDVQSALKACVDNRYPSPIPQGARNR